MGIKAMIVNGAAKTWFFVKRHKGAILTYGGLATSTAGTILACKNTLKLEEQVDISKKEIDAAKAIDGPESKKQLRKAYAKSAGRVAKLYAVPAGLICLADAMIVGGHVVLRRENAALTAAYMALGESFRRYRKRVKEDAGEVKDAEYMHGLKAEEVTTIDAETGETETTTRYKLRSHSASIYARWFETGNPFFTKNHEWNLTFLKQVEQTCNNLLTSQGHLFLNEVYDKLGIPRTKAGAIVGWVKNSKHGDSQVIFNVYEMMSDVSGFITDENNSILLDFNVDGPILSYFNDNQEMVEAFMHHPDWDETFATHPAVEEMDNEDYE